MNPMVHIVDDDQSFRTAVGRLLSASGYRVMLYGSGEEFLAGVREIASASCALLDLDMPGLNGLALQERLSHEAPLLPVLFLSGHADIKASVQAMKAGAVDFLEKPLDGIILLDAIARSLQRGAARLDESERNHAARTRLASLTTREVEVLQLLVRGTLNKQIAHALGTSERTIKAYRHSLIEKMGARNMAEAVSIAERLGVVAAAGEFSKS
ncbi:response regulator transcription factor [Rhizobium herbae]